MKLRRPLSLVGQPAESPGIDRMAEACARGNRSLPVVTHVHIVHRHRGRPPMLFSARRFIRRCLDGSVFKKGTDIVAQLGQAIGIPDLHLEDGSCTLSIEGTWVSLELDAAHSRILLSSYLMDAGPTLSAAAMRQLLQGTMDAIVDGTGMVLAIDDTEERVVMVTALFLDDLSGEDLANAMSRFVARVEQWNGCLNTSQAPTTSATVAPLNPTLMA